MASALSAARAYLGRGWCPIPLAPRDKRPVLGAWPELRPTEAELPRLFEPHSNVGIHLGPSGVVDVDLDCPEAVRLAPALLPSTPLRFGRDGAPASHWLFRCPEAAYEKLIHARETLAEVRAGEGKQTAMPPSIHPSGQVVRWEAGVDPSAPPAEVEPWALSGAVRRLAAAVLLCREGWTDASAVQAVRSPAPPANLPDSEVGARVREWCGWPAARPASGARGRTPVADPDAKHELREAAEAYVRDNAREWPSRNSTCPMCGGKNCFKAVPNSPRWACWSSSHEACGVGVRGPECWAGDVLDLDAHRAGMSVPEYLRDRGYLARAERLSRLPREARRPEASAPAEPERPAPGPVLEAAEAAVAAAAEAAGSREAPGSKAAAVAAWTAFVRGDVGLSGLAQAALSDPDRAGAVFDSLEAVYGLGTIAKSARAEFRRLAKSARIEERKRLAGLRVLPGAPEAGASDPDAPLSEVMERGDELEVAKRALHDYLHEHVVYDRSAIHRYDEESGAWLDYEPAHMIQVVQRFAGAPVFGGYDADGALKPPKPLSMSFRFAAGAVRFVEALQRKRWFFERRPAGCGFRNGFLRADGAWLEKSPAHRLLESEVLPFDYEPIDSMEEVAERAPRWHAFLCSLFEGDVDAWAKRQAIQEFIGATMLGLATRHQQALMLYGPGAGNGKSTLLKIVSQLFAPSSRCSIPPAQMGEKHVNVPLATARINIVNDMPDAEILDAGHLKAIISGDEVQWNPKNLPAFSASPRAGHVFAANTLPAVRDRSRGFWRRMLIVTFNRCFDEAPDRNRNIAGEVLEEREAIAAACLCAALNMSAEGYTTPSSSLEVLGGWEASANNVKEFTGLGWAAVGLPQLGTTGPVAYEAYRRHCEEGGVRPLGRNKFYDELARAGWKREQRDARRWLVTPEAGSEAEALLAAAQRRGP